MKNLQTPAPAGKRPRTPSTKAERLLRARLRDLVAAVDTHMLVLDALMKLPATPERGQQIARLVNRLNVAHDSAAHFGLGRSFVSLAKSRRVVLNIEKIKRWLEPTEAERVAVDARRRL